MCLGCARSRACRPALTANSDAEGARAVSMPLCLSKEENNLFLECARAVEEAFFGKVSKRPHARRSYKKPAAAHSRHDPLAPPTLSTPTHTLSTPPPPPPPCTTTPTNAPTHAHTQLKKTTMSQATASATPARHVPYRKAQKVRRAIVPPQPYPFHGLSNEVTLEAATVWATLELPGGVSTYVEFSIENPDQPTLEPGVVLDKRRVALTARSMYQNFLAGNSHPRGHTAPRHPETQSRRPHLNKQCRCSAEQRMAPGLHRPWHFCATLCHTDAGCCPCRVKLGIREEDNEDAIRVCHYCHGTVAPVVYNSLCLSPGSRKGWSGHYV